MVRVEGSTMGIALRVRWASGWWILVCWVVCWKLDGVKLVADGSRNVGVGWICCWSGEESGEPLESDDRSDPAELMD